MDTGRPSTADIAAAIDEFYADFGDQTAESDHGDPAPPEIAETETHDSVEQTTEILERLAQEHAVLCRRVKDVLIVRAQGRQKPPFDKSKLNETETRYRAGLKRWPQILKERQAIEEKYRTSEARTRRARDIKRQRVQVIKDKFEHFSLEISSDLLKGNNNKATIQTVRTFLAEEREAAAALHLERYEALHLEGERKQLEKRLAERDRLGNGLHLMDFEQLKIENQTLREKIDDREQQRLNLQKKIASIVQVLSHVREKLDFVNRRVITHQTAVLDAARILSREKINLQLMKSNCNEVKRRAKIEIQRCQRVTQPELLKDISQLVKIKARLIDTLQRLKELYASTRG